MNQSGLKKTNWRIASRLGRALAPLGLAALLWTTNAGRAGELTLTKYQVEAIFLFNFAKYVEWPATTFINAAAPITIGVMGQGPFGDNLQHAIEGKEIHGRPFVIKHISSEAELGQCQILFISHSEAGRTGEILHKAGALPILTVGEDEEFAQNGGIINFVLKNGNVRLEIDLIAARKAGLTISSRLLAVADVVKGKPN